MTLEIKNSKENGSSSPVSRFIPYSFSASLSGITTSTSIKVEICLAPNILIIFSLTVLCPSVARTVLFKPLSVTLTQENL